MVNFSKFIGFGPLQVTLLTVVTYATLISVLLWIHLVPPDVASLKELNHWGVDVEEAWRDLKVLTKEFHPYNSRRNDVVREYLVQRVHDILKDNGVEGFGVRADGSSYGGKVEVVDDSGKAGSNVTFAGGNSNGLTVYFEGTNLMVYIHGEKPASKLSPVLVNAHYDSVSTGYGATDDGTAVVSVLQIIKSFTRPESAGGKRLQRGLIALFNNGEEDFLNGARAFAVHPLGKVPHSFLNLEGAGAGGRATLFRSTDAEVTSFYSKSRRPFGTILSGDGFKRGLIRSQTDYKVFTEDLGMRGLDVAFWQPRSRYHTEEDDAKHSSRESLWHMLGGSLETLKALTDDTSSMFDPKDDSGSAGRGSDAVWFDFFGRAFAVLRLHTLFAETVTLLIVPPLGLLATAWILVNNYNKMYFFSNSRLPEPSPSHVLSLKTTQGWHGFFRFPIAFALASGTVVGIAFLLEMVNPMIVYSSQFPVWATFIGAWWTIAWLVLWLGNVTRPTALQRGYAWLQQWALWFLVLIGVAISIGQEKLGSGYWVLVFYTGSFLAAWISVLEMSALPKKPYLHEEDDRRYSSGGHSLIAASDDGSAHADQEEETGSQPTEETPLFRGSNRPASFAYDRNVLRRASSDDPRYEGESQPEGVYGREQAWSKDLPSWTWILQFFLAVPVQLMFVVPIGLFLGTALGQTGADGGGTLTVYLGIAVFSIVILLPVAPFLHRVTYHVTAFLFLVFVVTLIYNLVAFPFSPEAKLKVYFQQTLDLETGKNQVHLVGHPLFIQDIAAHIPSARGQSYCTDDAAKLGLARCSWEGPEPNTVHGTSPSNGLHPENRMAEWVRYNATKLKDGKARIALSGKNTRACKLMFAKPVSDIEVVNGWGGDEVFNGVGTKADAQYRKPPQSGEKAPTLGNPIPRGGTTELRLWSREWERGWVVDVEWEGSVGLSGRVVCLWSDANRAIEEIPALEEVKRYLPVWAVVSKLADGLVEGSVAFSV